jgi:hypothetical protein
MSAWKAEVDRPRRAGVRIRRRTSRRRTPLGHDYCRREGDRCGCIGLARTAPDSAAAPSPTPHVPSLARRQRAPLLCAGRHAHARDGGPGRAVIDALRSREVTAPGASNSIDSYFEAPRFAIDHQAFLPLPRRLSPRSRALGCHDASNTQQALGEALRVTTAPENRRDIHVA